MCVDAVKQAMTEALTIMWQLANSNFGIALIGGFAGALGGALGAQRIAEKSKKRSDRIREIRNVNAAIAIAHTVCNSALNLKSQFIKPMKLAMDSALKEFEERRKGIASGEIPRTSPLNIHMDMVHYPTPKLPIDSLKSLTYSEISAVGRILALVAAVEQAYIGLVEAVRRREDLTRKFASGEIPQTQHLQYYLGLPLPNGHTNREFPDIVEGIYSYLDDLAFFSHQLCEDLMAHGNRVRKAGSSRFSKSLPTVSSTDFSGPLASELLPPNSQYEKWLKGFRDISEN